MRVLYFTITFLKFRLKKFFLKHLIHTSLRYLINSLGYIPKRGIAGSLRMTVFKAFVT